jgi:hypothetical protein
MTAEPVAVNVVASHAASAEQSSSSDATFIVEQFGVDHLLPLNLLVLLPYGMYTSHVHL